MKKLLPSLALCAVLMASCREVPTASISQKDNPASYSMEKIDGNDTLAVYKTDKGYTISDAFYEDNNIHNVVVKDNQERTITVAAYCDYDFKIYKFLYDENNEIKGIVNYGGYETDNVTPYLYDSYDDSVAYSVLERQFNYKDDNFDFKKQMFDLILTKNENEPYFTRYYFLRDSLNRIVKLYDPILYRSIVAPRKYHIEYHVDNRELLTVYFTFVSNEKDDDTFESLKIYSYKKAFHYEGEEEHEH